MAVNGYFFDAVLNNGVYDRIYSAEDFSSYLDELVGNGVFPNPSTNLQVRADSDMNIIVSSGQGWIKGHKIINTADLQIAIANSDVLLNRIDRIIFYADFTNREMGITVLQGASAAQATAPELTRNTSRYEMCLAEITVNKQTSAITQAMITDTRTDSDLCGWVQGLIQQVDTSTLFTQWQTAYSNYYETMTAQFNAFMESLTQDLRVNTYVKQYDKVVQLTVNSSKTIPLDMNDYAYDSNDTILVIINGLIGVKNTDYMLDTTQATPEITVNLTGTANITDVVEIKVLKSIIGIQSIE